LSEFSVSGLDEREKLVGKADRDNKERAPRIIRHLTIMPKYGIA